jgi:DNA polymerase
MQNLPRGSQLKNAILAPAGHILVDCDSSQIEARTLAWLAEQDDLVTAFDEGKDVYKIMASAIYGKPVEVINKDERFIGKTTVLGAGYGMGAAKFQAQLKAMGVELPAEECEYIIKVYRKTYPDIQKLWWNTGDALEAMANDQTASIGLDGVLEVLGRDGIRLPNGLRLKYPNLRFEVDEESGRPEMVYDTKKGRAKIKTRIYGGKCVENICQALARIIIGEQMLMVSRRYKVAMTVHDAVVAVVPEDEAEEGQAFVEQCMRMRPKWASGLPLNCESKVGVSYGG